jgi:hypothetical protein
MMRTFVIASMMWAATLCSTWSAVPPGDAWCGTDGGELPDLWQQTMLELEALEEIPMADAWPYASGRVSVFLGRLALVQRAGTRQGQELMTQLRKTMGVAAAARAEVIESAGSTNREAYLRVVSDLRQAMSGLAGRYAPGSLKLAVASGASRPVLATNQPTLFVKAIAPTPVSNRTMQVDLRLRDGLGQGVGSLQLVEMHTRRLHVLVIDPSLEDYHHEHPITSGRPGDFVFHFTPRTSGPYLMWLDVTPLATGRNEMPQAIIGGAGVVTGLVSRTTQLQCTHEGWRFELRLDRKRVFAGEPVNARLRVTDPGGKACFGLEPLMGAFAHIVGFLDDRQTMIHVHSHGDPPHELSRSGPEVPFRFTAPKSGFLKVFVQTQVGGNVLLARFGLPVESIHERRELSP